MPGKGSTLAGILVAAWGFISATAARAEVNEDELRPGLVAIYRDSAQPVNGEFAQIEPTLALALKVGEAPHPRLAAKGGTIRWEGYLKVLRAGSYRFSVRLRGRLRVTVAGKEVLAVESRANTPPLLTGLETHLQAGVHPLAAEFTRLPGAARLEFFWQAEHFRTEPVPFDNLARLPAHAPARLDRDQQAERGRFLAEEHSCARCHQPDSDDPLAKGLLARQGPDLSQIGQRVFPGWLYAWLGAPRKLRPEAVMPQMFSDDETGRAERYAVTRYLASLGGPLTFAPPQTPPKDRAARVERGRRLFTGVGCIACHRTARNATKKTGAPNVFYPLGVPEGARPSYALLDLGSKTTPEKLASYLANPLAIDPSGRMPHMLLNARESGDLAWFLCSRTAETTDFQLPPEPDKARMLAAFREVDSRTEELTAFQRLPVEAQWIDLGKRLVIDKGCNNCHTIAPGGQPFASVLASASFDDVKKADLHTEGCLAREPAKHGKAPRFTWTESERAAITAFLHEGTSGAGSPAPAHATRVALQRFNCLACHVRDGEGGLSPEIYEELRKVEKAENAEAISPPLLTGVGHKLRTPWLQQVLTRAGRARPWMGLRMPQFGEAHVGKLPEALAALEGTEPDDTVHDVHLTAAKIEAGRRLVGKSGFGCISCHDLAGIPNAGTRGPDLASMNQRVRFDWYRRWLEQPQRLSPGTRMPTVFPDGKTLLTSVLGGHADTQAAALWAYLSLGSALPLPEGLELPKGLILAVKDRPIMLRTFMPEAGARAIAVGYPGGVSAAFDAATCRLAYAWSGNFLDASPVWNNRGGAPAHLLGARFWTASAGPSWLVSASQAVPNFAAHSKDLAFGAAVPEGQLYRGPRRIRFEGYTTDAAGMPTFRYRLHGAGPVAVEIQERPEPLSSPVAVGLVRHFTLDIPGQFTAWLLAGTAFQEPMLLADKGTLVPLDLKSGGADLPADGRLLVLPQAGARATILEVSAAPEGAHWRLERQGKTWQVMVRLPRLSQDARMQMTLALWVPYRDDPELLKDLLRRK